MAAGDPGCVAGSCTCGRNTRQVRAPLGPHQLLCRTDQCHLIEYTSFSSGHCSPPSRACTSCPECRGPCLSKETAVPSGAGKSILSGGLCNSRKSAKYYRGSAISRRSCKATHMPRTYVHPLLARSTNSRPSEVQAPVARQGCTYNQGMEHSPAPLG